MVFILQNAVCITQKKTLFLLKQASSSAVPNPDLLPIFFWFPLPVSTSMADVPTLPLTRWSSFKGFSMLNHQVRIRSVSF